MNLNHKDILDDIDVDQEPNYGKAVRTVRGLFDLSQKELAAKMSMSPQQLSRMEHEKSWTDEQLDRVCKSLNIPRNGLEKFAYPDIARLIIMHNTLGDGGIIGQNNFHNNYYFSDPQKGLEKVAELHRTEINNKEQEINNLKSQLGNKKK